MDQFENREQAGKALGKALAHLIKKTDLIVLALPRGGVPVGYEVAKSLAAPMDVFVVRKLGVPGQDELAMGAIAGDGERILDKNLIFNLGITPEQIELEAQREGIELRRRVSKYRGSRRPLQVLGKTVILVDDGLATGATMRAAIHGLRHLEPRSIVVAAPVAPSTTIEELREEVEQVVCLMTPSPFMAVGTWYQDFAQTTDGQVQELLQRAWAAESSAPGHRGLGEDLELSCE